MNSVGVRMAILSGVLFLAACSTGAGPDATGASKAADAAAAVDARESFGTTPWVLKSLPGHAGPVPTETREPLTLQMVQGEAGPELRGQGGCNSFAMGVAVNGAALKPGPIRASKMACEHLGFESAYFGVLGKVDAVRRDGETLQLLSAGTVTASYRR
jgi:heat shock protein HslJ